MADKTVSDLTSATTLDGTELFYLIQSANSRKVAGSEIVKISHNQAWSTITSTPTTLSGYGITDAQALDSDLTAIAALDKTDGNFIVADGTAWTVESGATARTSLGLGTAATTAATDYATAAQGATADSALQPGDIGTTVQAQGATLDSLEGLTLASGDVLYATAADTLANLAKGTEGQVLKVSATGIPEWGTVAGTGDMLAATYDPTSVAGDAFDMGNMIEATDAKVMTAAERTKLSGIEASADVTDAANVDAAGATMNTDTDVSANSWVLDEDDMASDSAAKVPTQQSVKAFKDTGRLGITPPILTNVDTVDETGWYRANTGTANGPTTDIAYVHHKRYDDNTAAQVWMTIGTTQGTSIRRKISGAWGSWLKVPENLADNHTWLAAQCSDIVTLTDGATITPALADSNKFTVTLGGNRTLANPTNKIVGQSFEIYVRQDATGGRTLSFGTQYLWPGGTAPTLSTAANAIDIIAGSLISSTEILCNIVKGFS